MRFEDEHTHDEFDIDVNEWIQSGTDDEGWKEYPVVWPGANPPPGQKSVSLFQAHVAHGNKTRKTKKKKEKNGVRLVYLFVYNHYLDQVYSEQKSDK